LSARVPAVRHAMAAWLIEHPDAPKVRVRAPVSEQLAAARKIRLRVAMPALAGDPTTRSFLGAVLAHCPDATVGDVLDALWFTPAN
jgi:hypothetical protein